MNYEELKFSKHSGIYTLQTSQEIDISLEEAWDFFSSSHNLSKITPKEMGFIITSPEGKKIHPGQIISYKVQILPGIRSNWVTEITHVQDKKFFVDEQRFGPYAMWHHEHHFEEHNGKVMMHDKISYKLPFSSITNLFHGIVIKPQLKKIFDYRRKVLQEIFE